MIAEPAPVRVVEGVDLGRAEEEVVSGFSVQVAVAGVPVSPRLGEVRRVDLRGITVGPHDDRPGVRGQPPGEGDRLACLLDAPALPVGRVVGHRGQLASRQGDLGEQDPLWHVHVGLEPGVPRVLPPPCDRDPSRLRDRAALRRVGHEVTGED